ncbi:M81 family metallopeptidase [Candidatus Entotheonella palauensis]|uniref:MlrC n=1 Tax=Entotheonella factor TaxID=1429438 RepID=W4L8B6_ENTF1|nr:M81 family metallopeptidase [Candidatus Entotheonella palauensis]ETW94298.1 MAG: hypothetical protein ETSY1_35495 [Candidatus Entotheonella factor]
MRIAIAGIVHETNTYCREQTPLSDFRVARGDDILARRGQESAVDGFVSACEEFGVEPVPILVAGAQPSGTIEAGAYDGFKQEILMGLRDRQPFDGVVLTLHGAGVVDGIDDLEADLAISVREVVGAHVPIVATFDLHGNIAQPMADALDGVLACHHYPHIDMHERSREAVRLIQRMVNEGLRTAIHVERIPVALPTTTTFFGIGQEVLAYMLEAEGAADVIDISWFHGFPYADTPLVSSTVVVTTSGDQQRAASIAKQLGHVIWERREAFQIESLSATEAVSKAVNAVADESNRKAGPVVINETSDNCGGGAPGDGTHLLRAMLDAHLVNACFGFIVDPEVAAQAHAAGVGRTISVRLGGKSDGLHGTPIEADVYVKALHDGALILQAMGRGGRLDLGPLARLVIEGIDVVVGSKRSQTFDAEPFLAVGIDVMRYDIVALKSSNHFRGYFQERAREIVTADPPGMTTLKVEVFPRQHTSVPLWPLDANAQYE